MVVFKITKRNLYVDLDKIYKDGMHEMSDAEWNEYCRQARESEGFDVRKFPNAFAHDIIKPLSLDGDIEDLKYFTSLGIAHYNEQQNSRLELVEIMKVMEQACCPFIYYITFKAKEVSTGQIDTCQTKVVIESLKESPIVKFTRVKPQTKSEVAPSDLDLNPARCRGNASTFYRHSILNKREEGCPCCKEQNRDASRMSLRGFNIITEGKDFEANVMRAVSHQGAVCAVLKANKEFRGLGKDEIYMGPKDPAKFMEAEMHVIVIVGHGSEWVDDELIDYWLIQNPTWGPDWADRGYGKIARKSSLRGAMSTENLICRASFGIY